MKESQLLKTILGMASTIGTLLCLSVFASAAIHPEQEWSYNHPRIHQLITVHEKVKPEVMAMEDVIGTAIGHDENGEPGIVVYVNQHGKHPAKSVRNIPSNLHGENITVELTEPFHAFTTSSVSHTVKQAAPIQLGTSGGWSYDLANGYCCGGTLGSLIKVGSTQYIMSNYHVFEADIVSGGNQKVSATGDPIIQPGLIDVGCSASKAQKVGSLRKISSLPNSNVDVSLAQVVPGMVNATGSILEIGTISSATIPASLNKAVKKSGRTSKLTHSIITGLNATVSVTYENECAGGTAFTKTFTGQIIIKNPSSSFLASGDSGSLMVEDVTINPKAVGLLFAGSTTLAVANPINDVLTYISGKLGGTASMVGN